jgi:hypothetical protein
MLPHICYPLFPYCPHSAAAGGRAAHARAPTPTPHSLPQGERATSVNVTAPYADVLLGNCGVFGALGVSRPRCEARRRMRVPADPPLMSLGLRTPYRPH